MKTSILKGLVPALVAASLVVTPTQANSNLENVTLLESCSPEIVEEFEYGSGVFGTNPYQRLLGGEQVITTGMSPFAEQKYSDCLKQNDLPINVQPLEIGMTYSTNHIPSESIVINTVKQNGNMFYLFHTPEN